MASKYKRLDSQRGPVQRGRYYESEADTEDEHLRIVLLGKTESGKSSLANTMFGKRLFEIGHTANAVTSQCKTETREVNGTAVSLIDTPGFFDDRKSEEKLKDELAKCVTECSSGLHAFLILLKVERFTEQEAEVITKIKESFSEEVFKYAVVVFTHGDQLPEGMTIKEYYHGSKGLHELLEKCGGRCHVFDNKYWNNNPQDEYRNNQRQIENLLNTIKEMVENNGGYYTNEMLRKVERRKQQEEESIRASSGNMSQEEVREEAEKRVYNFLKKAAGITTGVLLGALLGVPAMIVRVVKILESMPLIAAAGAAGAAAAAAAEGAAAGGVGLAVAEGAAVGGVGLAVAEGAAVGGVVLAAAAGVAAAAGAIVGGSVGYGEAVKVDSVKEAVENTANALCELVINLEQKKALCLKK